MDAHKVYEIATGITFLGLGTIWTRKDLLNGFMKFCFFLGAIAAAVLAFR